MTKKAYKNLKIEKEGTRILPIVIVGQPMGKLVTYTSYKAENAGRKVVLVNPKNTSKMCSNCGILVEKDLLKKLIFVLYVAYLLALILMLEKIFSDWDYNLFVILLFKSMDAPHFYEESNHLYL